MQSPIAVSSSARQPLHDDDTPACSTAFRKDRVRNFINSTSPLVAETRARTDMQLHTKLALYFVRNAYNYSNYCRTVPECLPIEQHILRRTWLYFWHSVRLHSIWVSDSTQNNCEVHSKTKATNARTRILLNYDQTSERSLRKDAKMWKIFIKNKAK